MALHSGHARRRARCGGGVMTKITITSFDNLAANEKDEKQLTLERLAQYIRKETAPEKHHLPMLKFARFGNSPTKLGSLRNNDNVKAITGIEADYDGEKDGFDDAVDVLEKVGIEAIVYTSPSHSRKKPRWRICCPLSRELPPSERD